MDRLTAVATPSAQSGDAPDASTRPKMLALRRAAAAATLDEGAGEEAAAGRASAPTLPTNTRPAPAKAGPAQERDGGGDNQRAQALGGDNQRAQALGGDNRRAQELVAGLVGVLAQENLTSSAREDRWLGLGLGVGVGLGLGLGLGAPVVLRERGQVGG